MTADLGPVLLFLNCKEKLLTLGWRFVTPLVSDALKALYLSFGLFDESYTCPWMVTHPSLSPFGSWWLCCFERCQLCWRCKEHLLIHEQLVVCGPFCVATAQEAVKTGKEWWRAVQCVFCWIRFAAVAYIWCFILHNWTWRWILYMGDLWAMQMGKIGAGVLRIVFSFTGLDIIKSLKWHHARGQGQRNTKRISFSVWQSRPEKKKREQWSRCPIGWACNCDLQMSFLLVCLCIFLKKKLMYVFD